MRINDILNNIDNESLALPVFQRGYVWKRRQVKELMNSLYNGNPVGSLLTWTTRAERVEIRGESERISGAIDLLLDGQQRVTSLYGIMRGKPPAFFDGDVGAFSELYFNLEDEEFDFFAPGRMRNNPLWVSVTQLFDTGNDWLSPLTSNPTFSEKLATYLQRVSKIQQIRDRDLHIEPVTGEDKTTDIVVDIFNRVNSGGTKLSKGDLTLARIGAHWPEARTEMQQRLTKWEGSNFSASLDWLLRCMNVILTGGSEFERIGDQHIVEESVKRSLQRTEIAVDHLLEAMRSHLHMDIDRVYTSKAAFPVMVKYLDNNGGRFTDQAAMARLLHWYVSVAIWGRFSGPTETVVNQDLAALNDSDPVAALLRNLRISQGERSVTHENFDLSYTKARFYPLLYMMSRIQDARDWGTGNRLRHHSLGDHTNLELHHIFPKAYLRRHGISSKDADNMGNIAFQTRETNRAIGDSSPVEYMSEIAANWPGALESQWIPAIPDLWQVENYYGFLDARRRLLADSANSMLDTLRAGMIPPADELLAPMWQRSFTSVEGSIDTVSFDEAESLNSANSFALERGLPAGELAYEITDQDTGLLITLDLAWPEGMQIGFSRPVALLIDEDDSVHSAAGDAGFRVFTSLDSFRRYVERDILAQAV